MKTRYSFRSRSVRFIIAASWLAGAWNSAVPSLRGAGFDLEDHAGKHLDVRFDGKVAARYMYAYDKSTADRLHETYKPYLHIFDADGQAPITKGPGGQFTHHRGIFVGWNRINVDGASYDLWHMKGCEQIHQKFLKNEAHGGQAAITSLIIWNDTHGQPLIEEQRAMTFQKAPGPGLLRVDIQTRLVTQRSGLRLDGDPEHAGVQYRPANEVIKEETTYVFPKENANPKEDLDYSWVGETYTLGSKRYSVVQLNHPGNPKGTVFSAYRDYGRFGAFFKRDLKPAEPLTLKYRFLISEGEMPDAARIQKAWDEFAGASRPSAVPAVTVVKSGS